MKIMKRFWCIQHYIDLRVWCKLLGNHKDLPLMLAEQRIIFLTSKHLQCPYFFSIKNVQNLVVPLGLFVIRKPLLEINLIFQKPFNTTSHCTRARPKRHRRDSRKREKILVCDWSEFEIIALCERDVFNSAVVGWVQHVLRILFGGLWFRAVHGLCLCRFFVPRFWLKEVHCAMCPGKGLYNAITITNKYLPLHTYTAVLPSQPTGATSYDEGIE